MYTRQSAVGYAPDARNRVQVAPKAPTQQEVHQAVKMRAIDRKIRLSALPKWVGQELQCARCKGSFLGISYRRCSCPVLSPFELKQLGYRV